jgi:hypothetical protein
MEDDDILMKASAQDSMYEDELKINPSNEY